MHYKDIYKINIFLKGFKNPVSKSPVSKSPVSKSLVSKSPVSKSPVLNRPVLKSPDTSFNRHLKYKWRTLEI